MTEIFINPTKKNIAIQINSQSLHALGFEITVFATDGNTVIEQFTGDTKVNNPFSKTLKNAPATYKGCYVSGTFTVISPDGKDYLYSILYSILEEGITINPALTLTGTTTNGQDSIISVYHIN
jgi:hypothetical protein